MVALVKWIETTLPMGTKHVHGSMRDVPAHDRRVKREPGSGTNVMRSGLRLDNHLLSRPGPRVTRELLEDREGPPSETTATCELTFELDVDAEELKLDSKKILSQSLMVVPDARFSSGAERQGKIGIRLLRIRIWAYRVHP